MGFKQSGGNRGVSWILFVTKLHCSSLRENFLPKLKGTINKLLLEIFGADFLL